MRATLRLLIHARPALSSSSKSLKPRCWRTTQRLAAFSLWIRSRFSCSAFCLCSSLSRLERVSCSLLRQSSRCWYCLASSCGLGLLLIVVVVVVVVVGVTAGAVPALHSLSPTLFSPLEPALGPASSDPEPPSITPGS